MSKTKNNKLLVPLVSAREPRLRPLYDSKQIKETDKKKELLIKAYDNDKVLLPRSRFRRQQENKVAVSFQERVSGATAAVAAVNYRYGPPKLELNEYLQEERLPQKFGKSYIRQTSRPRPGSLFKISEKSSVADIRPKRYEGDRSTSNIDMSEHHSVDLFKMKQSNQRRSSIHQDSTISNARLKLEEGRRLYRQGKQNQAQKCFAQIINDQPKHLEALYFLAVISLNNKQFDKSLQYLGDIINTRPDYKKSVYLFMCITLKNLDRREEAVSVASQGLAIFSDYFDLLLYRAKLYQGEKKFDTAERDYDAALAIKDDNAQAYYKKGQCYIQMKEWKKAVTSLTTSIYLDQGFKLKSLQERARAYLELHNLTEAKKDIDKLIASDPGSSQNFELRGMLQGRENQVNEAILSFEQCIKNNTSKASLATALVEITKFKIKDRDFYSAYHHICRSEFLELKAPAVEMYKLFTQGVIFLMKRKTTEGLANFNQMRDKHPQMDDFLLKLFYLYRAYGYFVSSQHEKCLQDYRDAEKYQKKDRHAIFNMLIAEGIVSAKTDAFDQAFELFNRAQTLLPNRLEPYLYRSVTHVLFACRTLGDDEIKRLEMVFLALKELDKAYDMNNANSNQLFLRGLIYYYLGKINEGLEDIGRAISKSEENVPKYFFYRGLGQGTLKNYKQCQNDMTICINLDEKFTQAYLERSKAFFLEGQTQKAVDDIAKYAELNLQADRYFIQGNLYFSNSDYDEAMKRYRKGKGDRQTLRMQVKCCIVMGDYAQAQAVLSQMNEIYADEHVSDLAILRFLQILSKEAEKDTSLPSSDAIREILETLNNEPKTHSEGIFSELHLYHYMGACHFYLGDYNAALMEFSKAHKEKELLNIESELDYKDIKNILNSEESHNEDPFASGDKDFNEINYNIFLCYIKMGEHKKAYELFIRDIMPAKENVFQNELLSVFSRMIFHSMKKADPADKPPHEPAASASGTSDVQITLFDNVLSSGVPYLTLQLKENRVRTKPCLLLPNMRLNRMLPQVISKEIILRINLSEVENKPEPPWVKRSQQENLIFTDDIQSVDNIEFNTEENQDESQEEEEQEQEEGEDYEQEEEEEQLPGEQFDIEKIKQAMKLDDSIEQKLNKLIGRSKKPEEPGQ